MKILVINAGSSSLKYQLIDMDNEQMVCKGNCERIGMPGGIFTHKTADGRELKKNVNMLDHAAAFMQVKNALIDGEYGVIKQSGRGCRRGPPHRAGRLYLPRVRAGGREGNRGY